MVLTNFDWNAIASSATAVGVIVAVVQFGLQLRQSKIAFEDSFAKEYRDLIAGLPAKVFFGAELNWDEFQESLDEFYHYFDLCNEQAYLARSRRISSKTWRFWKSGITDNLKKPAFQKAWNYISEHAPEDFTELKRQLETVD